MKSGTKAYEQGRYGETERLWLAALAEAEKFGEKDPRLATSLNNLAALYRAQGKYAEAEPLYRRALAIREKAWGRNTPTWPRAWRITLCCYERRAVRPRLKQWKTVPKQFAPSRLKAAQENEAKMQREAAKQFEFEKAAALRDHIRALKSKEIFVARG